MSSVVSVQFMIERRVVLLEPVLSGVLMKIRIFLIALLIIYLDFKNVINHIYN
jgi:hypothetical protein